QELGWRLHFALKALAGVLAGDELGNLMPAFTQGRRMSDAQVLAQLTSMVVAALKAPSPAPQELGALQDVFEIGETQHADEQAHLAALAATVEGESHEAAAAAAAALGRARRSARQVRNEGATRAATASMAVRREHCATFPSNPLDDWMRTRPRS
ncbi:MAG TPA: TetR/AcrR family transcriptional regulator, partial [Cupriavidus sp.]|nr:TetR/AcrR family transcriptional regulator [Cupriavidus sp.]